MLSFVPKLVMELHQCFRMEEKKVMSTSAFVRLMQKHGERVMESIMEIIICINIVVSLLNIFTRVGDKMSFIGEFYFWT